MRVVAAQAAVYRAREQLEQVMNLQWESPAGRAFRDRAAELAGKVADLDARLASARGEIWSARADLAELEAVILSSAGALGYPAAPGVRSGGLSGGL